MTRRLEGRLVMTWAHARPAIHPRHSVMHPRQPMSARRAMMMKSQCPLQLWPRSQPLHVHAKNPERYPRRNHVPRERQPAKKHQRKQKGRQRWIRWRRRKRPLRKNKLGSRMMLRRSCTQYLSWNTSQQQHFVCQAIEHTVSSLYQTNFLDHVWPLFIFVSSQISQVYSAAHTLAKAKGKSSEESKVIATEARLKYLNSNWGTNEFSPTFWRHFFGEHLGHINKTKVGDAWGASQPHGCQEVAEVGLMILFWQQWPWQQ